MTARSPAFGAPLRSAARRWAWTLLLLASLPALPGAPTDPNINLPAASAPASATSAPAASPPFSQARSPLVLERDPVTLPNAGLGRAYAKTVRAEGGLPPYVFDLLQGELPGGLTLDDDGRISGTPTQAGRHRFRVRVVDAAGDAVSQRYSLRVFIPAAPAARPPAAKASAPVKPLSQLDPSQAGPPAHAEPTARVFRLEPAQLDALKATIQGADAAPMAADAEPPPEPPPEADPAPEASAPPTPAPPAGLVWSEAQHTQLEALLKPVMAVEYPTQALFEAAVDAQVCAQAWQLIVHEAQRLKQQPPSQAEFATLCPPPPANASPKAAPAARPAAAQPLTWRELPGWLMPLGLRPWLAAAAARERPLLLTQPPPWAATPACRCAEPRPTAPLFAVYPAWQAADPPPQTLDFGLINRITFLALPLGDDRALDQAMNWTEAQTAFIRTARAYETRVDLGLYGADWRFLATEPEGAREALITQMTTQATRRARELLDRPLPGLASRAKAWLPGFGRVQHTGDGYTLFFDRLPDPAREPVLAARFADFLPRYVKGLALAMGQTPTRQYAINLVMTDRQLTDQPGPYEVARLFELLKAVEVPDMADGRIVETHGDYTRNSNVALRLLVLLTEPTSQSKKKLRAAIEAGAGLYGGDRRIFLRSVVPLLLLPQASAEQYRDDLVYMQDNFGGTGFWPAPLMGQQFQADQQQALRDTFDPGTDVGDTLCGLICPNRWPLRLVFEVLLLAGAVCALLLLNCTWRAGWGRYAVLGGIPPLLVGAALLQCDPALEALRQGNAQLLALLAIPVLAAAWVVVRRKEVKP